MPEPEDRSLFVLDVVPGGHGHATVAQRFARGEQPVAGVDLASELLAQRVQRLA
jgi:hypothetical protein